jgi:hypothetical protein
MNNMAMNADEQLMLALDDYLVQSLANLPSESELAASQSFSCRFERRMRRLVRLAEKKAEQTRLAAKTDLPDTRLRSFSTTKKRLLLVAVILALLLSVMSITAAREAVIGFLVEIYEKFSTVVFKPVPGMANPGTLPLSAEDSQKMLPTALPEGYTQADVQIYDQLIRVIYISYDGNNLILELILSANKQMQIDTEGVSAEDVQVRQTDGLYYSNKGHQTLIWQEGPYAYVISGIITKNELLNMAESINR